MASKRTVSVSEDSTRSNSSFSMESSKKRDGDLGNLANPARLKLIQDNVTQLESMTQGQLLAEMILADDVSTRNASHRTLATASRLVRETAQLMTALFPDNRDASPADMPAELRTRLTAVEEAIQDLSKRAGSLLAVETRDVNRIPRLSRSQTESLTSVLHFHRERFWRKLFEFPVVALKHFEVLREVAAGKGTPSDHIFEASFRGGGEALLRLHAQRVLTEIALLQEGRELSNPQQLPKSIAELLCQAPMKPEAALESAARLKEKVAALCRLERSLVSEHTSMRDAAQHRDPRYSEWLALRNELGAPADEARALLAHLEALAKPYLAIRDYLFAANKRLVFSCIPKQHYGRHFSEDLIQAGDIGLLRAVERFDPASGYQFSTCGRLWIKQQMLVFFRDQFNLIRVPSHLVKAATQLKRMLEEGASSSSLSAHASELGLPLDQQRALLRLTRPIVSIFNPVDRSQNRLANLITAPSSDSATSLFEAQEAAQRVNDVLRFLNPRLRFIIESRFGIERPEGLTLEEIGRTLKVTKERVRQLERKAIKRLYSILMRQGGSSSAEEN